MNQTTTIITDTDTIAINTRSAQKGVLTTLYRQLGLQPPAAERAAAADLHMFPPPETYERCQAE